MTVPKGHKSTSEGHFPLLKEGPQKPRPSARGAGKGAAQTPPPLPPPRSAPTRLPAAPQNLGEQPQPDGPGSSQAEDQSTPAQTWARSLSRQAALQGKPPAGPAGHPISRNVTYCEVTPSRASDPLTPRPQAPGLPPRPSSCRPSKREPAGPQYLRGGPQRRPGPAAPKGGCGQQPAVEHGGRHF